MHLPTAPPATTNLIHFMLMQKSHRGSLSAPSEVRATPAPAAPRGGETPLTAGTVLAIGTHNQHQLIQAVGAMPQPTGVAGRPGQCSPCRSRETQAYESYLMPGKATQNLRHRQIWREPSTGMCLTWNYFRQTATKSLPGASEHRIGIRNRGETPQRTETKQNTTPHTL